MKISAKWTGFVLWKGLACVIKKRLDSIPIICLSSDKFSFFIQPHAMLGLCLYLKEFQSMFTYVYEVMLIKKNVGFIGRTQTYAF